MTTAFHKSALLAAVSLVALGLQGASAEARNLQPYVSVFGGASTLNDLNVTNASSYSYNWKFNTGYIIGGAIGVKWNDMLRSELELSHAVWNAKNVAFQTYDGTPRTNPANGNLNATYLLNNIWLDVPTHSMVTPYLGGGIGVGWANADVTGGKGPQLLGGNSGVALQLGAGLKIAVSERIDVDMGYRFKDLMNITFQDGGGSPYSPVNLQSHNFQVGMTVKF